MTRQITSGVRLSLTAAVLILAGCATKEPATQAAATPPASSPHARAVSTMPRTPSGARIVAGSLQDFNVNVGDRVFFAFDQSNLDDAARAILQKQAAWLQRYPAVTMQLEGNCDERGTREYNIALGARRAAAAKDYLMSLGVGTARLTTISYGKEKPVCTESNEACWAQNRRTVSAISNAVSSPPNVAMR